MLKDHVNGCHGNHANFHGVIEYIFVDKIICISVVPINDLASMKNYPRGCKVGQISSRCTYVLEEKTYIQRMQERTDDRIKQYPLTHRLNSSIVGYNQIHSIHFLRKISCNAMFSIDFDGNTSNSYIGK